MQADETSHQTQRAHKTWFVYDVGKISVGCLVSTVYFALISLVLICQLLILQLFCLSV